MATDGEWGSGTWTRATVLVGLVALAITQPVLELLGRNPEFFVAGHYTSRQIVLFGFVVAFVPALLVTTAVGVTTRLHRRLGRVVYLLLLAALGALFGNVLVRGLGLDSGGAALAASLLGSAAAVLLARVGPGRLLLQYLSVANVLFLAGFLLMSPTSRLLSGGEGGLGRVSVPELRGPVVVIVLDELPVSTLLRVDGTVNADRFPNFAKLAERSTWYRNASSHHSRTHRAVPALLAGRMPERGQLPSYRDHPRNLLSLLGSEVPVERYELVTDLCPPGACAPPPAQPLRQALRDAGVVYLHRALPEPLRSDLPAIDHSWGGFGDELGGEEVAGEEEAEQTDPFARYKAIGAGEKRAPSQAAILVERGEAVGSDAALHLIHVALPHYPWIFSPWGAQLMEYPRRVTDAADPAYEWSSRLQFQLHSMQVGAADVALGRIMDHLEESGVWDDTTLVVVSDHGISLLPPDFGRTPTDTNEQELFRIPLFIKAAGQQEGDVRDEPAQSIDLLPTLIDLLDVDVDWDLDGHSLLDGSDPEVEPLVGRDLEPLFDLVRRHAADFPTGDGWTALAAVGDHRDVVGRPISAFEVGSASELTWRPDHEEEFTDLPTADGKAPQLLTGLVEQPGGGRPPELLVVVNGTVAGITGGYVVDGGSWRFTSFLGPYLRDGANEIVAYEVEDRPGGPVLRPVE